MKAGTTDLFAIRTPQPKRQKNPKNSMLFCLWNVCLCHTVLDIRDAVSFTIEFVTKNFTFAEFWNKHHCCVFTLHMNPCSVATQFTICNDVHIQLESPIKMNTILYAWPTYNDVNIFHRTSWTFPSNFVCHHISWLAAYKMPLLDIYIDEYRPMFTIQCALIISNKFGLTS